MFLGSSDRLIHSRLFILLLVFVSMSTKEHTSTFVYTVYKNGINAFQLLECLPEKCSDVAHCIHIPSKNTHNFSACLFLSFSRLKHAGISRQTVVGKREGMFTHVLWEHFIHLRIELNPKGFSCLTCISPAQHFQ